VAPVEVTVPGCEVTFSMRPGQDCSLRRPASLAFQAIWNSLDSCRTRVAATRCTAVLVQSGQPTQVELDIYFRWRFAFISEAEPDGGQLLRFARKR